MMMMMMIRRVNRKNLLTLENVIRYSQLGYRTKINKEMPLLERFVNKVNFKLLVFDLPKVEYKHPVLPCSFVVCLN